MAAPPPASPTDNNIVFFGNCPTPWSSLTVTQKLSCSALVPLRRRVEGYFAWRVIGELRTQWNHLGSEEYSIAVGPAEKLNSGFFKLSFRREKITLSYDIRLLSNSDIREDAKPFIIITSNNKKAAEVAISRIKQHPRLCAYSFEYLICLTGIKPSAGTPTQHNNIRTRKEGGFRSEILAIGGMNSNTGVSPVNGVTSSSEGVTARSSHHYAPSSVSELQSINISSETGNMSLCGARMAVYPHNGTFRGKRKNVATIGGVFRVGDTRYALTAAHVFFGDVESTGSWVDSGLFVTSSTTKSSEQTESPPEPRTYEMYEVVIESLWPHNMTTSGSQTQTEKSIGLVVPSVSRRRRDTYNASLSTVIFDLKLDWALVELKDDHLWMANVLLLEGGQNLQLYPPSIKQEPPEDELIMATGISGIVTGPALGTKSGIMLPWSAQEIKTWSVECEIAVGDCGSFAVNAESGEVVGMVIAHDPDTWLTYIVPAISLFDSISDRFKQNRVSVPEMFSPQAKGSTALTTGPDEDGDNRRIQTQKSIDILTDSHKSKIVNSFLDKLKSLTLVSTDGRSYVRRARLEEWLLERANSNSHVELLLDAVYTRELVPPIRASQISAGPDSFLTVFAVLLAVDCGHLIHNFCRHDLRNSRLPFAMDVLTRMGGMNAQTVNSILNRQWAYCPIVLDLDMDRDLPSTMVVPVLQEDQINMKGARATVRRIVVLEEYIGSSLRQALLRSRFNVESDTLGPRYELVLKSFSASNEKYFKLERHAFHMLRHTKGMMQCLGSYTLESQPQNDGSVSSHVYSTESLKRGYLLLEYGRLDLDEYFFSSEMPPLLSSDIVLFWQNLSTITDTVSNIHEFNLQRGATSTQIHGWHSDIKPDNILLVNEVFKLADPGFARFETSSTDKTQLIGGTVTYGAPEVCATNDRQVPLSQAVDTWSLGCVFSVAATWVIGGANLVFAYQQIRERAVKESFAQWEDVCTNYIIPTDAFHDGRDVLGVVTDWHKYLRIIARRTDAVTCQVLDLVDNRMLVGDSTSRAHAAQISGELREILSRTDSELDRLIIPSSIRRMVTTQSASPQMINRYKPSSPYGFIDKNLRSIKSSLSSDAGQNSERYDLGFLSITQRTKQDYQQRREFCSIYDLDPASQNRITRHHSIADFQSRADELLYKGDYGQLVIINGFAPSPWVLALGLQYNVDPRIFEHYESNELIPYDLPTFRTDAEKPIVLKLTVTTIVPISRSQDSSGKQKTSGSTLQQQMTRTLDRARKLAASTGRFQDTGAAVVRNFTVLKSQHLAYEQDILIVVDMTQQSWRGIVWLDHGMDIGQGQTQWLAKFLSSDSTSSATISDSSLSKTLDVMDAQSIFKTDSNGEYNNFQEYMSKVSQHTAHGLDATAAARDPFYALNNVLLATIMSENQILNLMEANLSQDSQDFTTVKDTDEYVSILATNNDLLKLLKRYISRLQKTTETMSNFYSSSRAPSNIDERSRSRIDAASQQIQTDIQHLLRRAQSLHNQYSDNMTVLMNQLALTESKRSIDQSAQVRILTVFAMLFLPASTAVTFVVMNPFNYSSTSPEYNRRTMFSLYVSVTAVVIIMSIWILFKKKALEAILDWLERLLKFFLGEEIFKKWLSTKSD